jgi:hypothetical protein
MNLLDLYNQRGLSGARSAAEFQGRGKPSNQFLRCSQYTSIAVRLLEKFFLPDIESSM